MTTTNLSSREVSKSRRAASASATARFLKMLFQPVRIVPSPEGTDAYDAAEGADFHQVKRGPLVLAFARTKADARRTSAAIERRLTIATIMLDKLRGPMTTTALFGAVGKEVPADIAVSLLDNYSEMWNTYHMLMNARLLTFNGLTRRVEVVA